MPRPKKGNNVYRIFFRVRETGVQVLWNFPSIGAQRASGYLNDGREYSSVDAAVKYARKYARHYPVKGIIWRIDAPTEAEAPQE